MLLRIRNSVFVLFFLVTMASCENSRARSTDLVAWLQKQNAKVYSINDVSEYSRRWMTLPVPPSKNITDLEIGAVVLKKGTMVDRDFAKRLSLASSLKLLDLEDCELCDEFFDLIETDRLEFLFVSGSNFSDTHCKRLSDAPNLKLIVVERCKLSRAGISLLESSPGRPEVCTWFRD